MTPEHDEWMRGIKRVMDDHVGCPTIVVINDPSGLKVIANFDNYALQMGMFDIAKLLTGMRFQESCKLQSQTGEVKAMEQDMRLAMSGKKPEGVN